MPLQRVYAIGIQHQRLVQRQQAAHQRIALRAAAQTAAQCYHIAACGTAADGFLRRQREPALQRGQRVGHGLIGLHRRHLPNIGRDAQKDQPAAGADGGAGAEHRRAGVAHAAPQHVHLAEIPLVARRVAGRQGGLYIVKVDGQHAHCSSRRFLFSIA